MTSTILVVQAPRSISSHHSRIPPASFKLQPHTLETLQRRKARRGSIKTTKLVESKSMGTKRALGTGQVRSARKRQRNKQQPAPDIEPHVVDDLDGEELQGQVFRFMDLPGELRNRVYEYAIGITQRTFPLKLAMEKPKVRRGRYRDLSTSSSGLAHTGNTIDIPWIGLTQACSLLRAEFRPAWLSTHKVPLCAMDGYLKAFFPTIDPYVSIEARKRFESYSSTSASFCVWVRKEELFDADIVKLLKHMIRFPDIAVTCHAFPTVNEVTLNAIQALLSNKNATWIKWIKNNTISQVRLMMRRCADADSPVRIVVKERYAPQWMRPTLNADTRIPDGYVESLGLGEVAKGRKIAFGVDYA
ncbi:hypothetical protein EK21DRAFT_96967 [Setomelanomma holmii]|uniref:Uncharacterized protein n=1 Tax=Setomelanomma holmii TaxID=210430 RepID=A0A9P4HL55_9PLEO|nr:hypothetical protein EK21DRAFT_96967 [Setomelanomma holmii]